ncbi:MAG: M48 family metalloprotease [Desulfobulbaceae bacterium]|nr:M48 family metalloprotease [Desulfobulbaceae bacterium]
MKYIFSRRDFLQHVGKISLAGAGAYGLTSMLHGCISADISSTLSQVSRHSGSIINVAKAGIKTFDDFTPEQEYYIGRTVGALILEKYKPYDNTEVTRYVNILGQTIARASDLPETFNGYHFLVLDSNEINAFATPSGLIFITRGMLGCCADEGELAAVLAHEVGHVQLKHGLQAIKKGRFTEFGSILAMETTKALTDSEVAQLVESFEGTISDITTTMINNGYSRSFEVDADKSAAIIMGRVGYNPTSLITMLEAMDAKLQPGGRDFAKTHPSPSSRINYLAKRITTEQDPETPDARARRFREAMKIS